MNITICPALPADAEEILAIYKPYVEGTAITFEYDVPTAEEFRARIEQTLSFYPYLKAVCDGKIVGYTYASCFKSRAAYDWAVETSIYVDRNLKRAGVGSLLYAELERYLKAQGIINLNACIAVPNAEDEYLNWDSVRFHEKMGYRMVGEFRQCGYKFNRWYNMVWMEKMIGDHLNDQPPVRAFGDVYNERIREEH